MTTGAMKSLADLQRHSRDLAARRPEDDPRVRRLQSLKQATWLALLLLSFVGYHLLDRMSEALSIM